MYIVGVNVIVLANHIEEFILATRQNAVGTRQEKGNVRFDVLQSMENPTQFFLYEVYQSEEDFKAHQQTEHYLTWRETVHKWMAEKRVGTKYTNLFPNDEEWNKI